MQAAFLKSYTGYLSTKRCEAYLSSDTFHLYRIKNAVWKATLNVANSADGRKILYDIDPIKKVEGAINSAPTTTEYSISQSEENVNRELNLIPFCDLLLIYTKHLKDNDELVILQMFGVNQQ